MAEKLNLKVYVAVKVDFNEDGIMLPRTITWEMATSMRSTVYWISARPLQ